MNQSQAATIADQAKIQALIVQRDNAMNTIVNLQAEVAVAQHTIRELRDEVARLTPSESTDNGGSDGND